MHDFRKLKVWQKSKQLAIDVYALTASYPRGERFGLVQQTRSAATSIPANIAEGCGRGTQRELSRFLDIALGSAYELASHIEVARELQWFDPPAAEVALNSVNEVCRMLVGLRRSLIR